MSSNLSMVEAKLPPGFRFHPRDEELIYDYLMKKIAGTSCYPVMIEVDLNNCEPWDIPETACVGGKDWYFYSNRDRKYATGLRTNRATVSGYWKATGKDRHIHRNGRLLGMRKTLVFYQGRAPKGRKSDWVMHEFRLEGPAAAAIIPSSSNSKEDWVLCKVFNKTKDQLQSESESAAAAAKLQQGMLGPGNSSSSSSSCCFDDTPFITCSSDHDLPPLMEYSNSYMINNFHNQPQPPPSAIGGGKSDFHQQVPCFSNNNKPNDHDHDHDFPYMMTTTMMSNNTSTSIFLPPPLVSSSSSCGADDNNVLLPQLNHNYDNIRSFSIKESPSLDQTLLLSDHHVDLPPIWDY